MAVDQPRDQRVAAPVQAGEILGQVEPLAGVADPPVLDPHVPARRNPQPRDREKDQRLGDQHRHVQRDRLPAVHADDLERELRVMIGGKRQRNVLHDVREHVDREPEPGEHGHGQEDEVDHGECGPIGIWSSLVVP